MVRKFLFAAALAAGVMGGVAATPAAAQSYGGVTLTFGNSGYYDGGRYGYRSDYRDRRDWRARDRYERRLRAERERAWRQRAWRERHYYRDRDRDRYRDYNGRRYGY